ncbi:urea transporter [Caballeronia ptereochthonis]|uniref:Urea transporter n=1 Tax=Caballeronia ptereochthonis TaxID=1777144 RepID=A0A157ZIY9_9BURK|nr:urea transporter [Caballeronia ptereochthonis]SAK45504.1 urea transporter [Caballeronia ptereochthonis]
MSSALHSDAAFGDQLRSFARAIGQIVLQRNAATGALLFLAVLCASPRLACGLLTGTLTGNVISVIIEDADAPAFRDDLYGFNGALAALAAFTFIGDASRAAAVAIVAAMSATFLAHKLTRILARHALPIFSSPAIIVTWCWLPLFADRGDTGAIPPVAAGFIPMLQAAFAGLAPITFATGALAGGLIAAGLLAARPSQAGWALTGSALGAALHGLGGASDAVVLSGACGFNAALAALAAAPIGKRYALLAIVAAVLIERLIDCLGIAALTAPFVLASWAVIALRRRLSGTSKQGDSHVVHPHA